MEANKPRMFGLEAMPLAKELPLAAMCGAQVNIS
jgi:hypothetical protein